MASSFGSCNDPGRHEGEVIGGDGKVWVRLRYSTLTACANALRWFGKHLYDEARAQSAVGDEKHAEHTHAESAHLFAASREIQDEQHRVRHDGGTLDAAVEKEAKGEP